jgi:hypothetical protein
MSSTRREKIVSQADARSSREREGGHMNPHQFHIEHGRLMNAQLERDASRRHPAPGRPRRAPSMPAVRFHLPRFSRARHAVRHA